MGVLLEITEGGTDAAAREGIGLVEHEAEGSRVIEEGLISREVLEYRTVAERISGTAVQVGVHVAEVRPTVAHVNGHARIRRNKLWDTLIKEKAKVLIDGTCHRDQGKVAETVSVGIL